VHVEIPNKELISFIKYDAKIAICLQKWSSDIGNDIKKFVGEKYVLGDIHDSGNMQMYTCGKVKLMSEQKDLDDNASTTYVEPLDCNDLYMMFNE
jgi:hypothetical protein